MPLCDQCLLRRLWGTPRNTHVLPLVGHRAAGSPWESCRRHCEVFTWLHWQPIFAPRREFFSKEWILEGNVQQSVFPKLSLVTKRRKVHQKMPEFISLLMRTVSQGERGMAVCKGCNWGRSCAGWWSGGRHPTGEALLHGSCMCCVAFLCCLFLTAGRSGVPKQSLVLKKLVGES